VDAQQIGMVLVKAPVPGSTSGHPQALASAGSLRNLLTDDSLSGHTSEWLCGGI